jgi:Homeodomain-like domain
VDESALSSADPEIGLRAVAALHRLADRMESIQVAHARRQGWSWARIAAELGVSKQAVHQKHHENGDQ